MPAHLARGLVKLNPISLEVTRNMAKVLGRTQYYPPEKMQAYQRKLLEPLLRHARKEVPFYARRLDPVFAHDDSMRWEAWGEIPTFTRADAQDAGEALFANFLPEHVGGYSENNTSGSTGAPLQCRVSTTASLINAAASQRTFEWHEIDLSGKMALIVEGEGKYKYPEGQIGKKWNVANPEAPACQLSVTEPIANQLEWLLTTKPDILITYPSIAVALYELAAQRKEIPTIHTFIGQGEVFNEEAKYYLAGTHGLKLVDRYGASELGAIAGQCPTENRHHQFYEANLMEVLDFSGQCLVAEGRGRLVLTPFYNYAMPLIRYENQDQVEITQAPCPCGRTLPSIMKVLGRERHVFTYSEGSRSWPSVSKHEYSGFLPSKQIQAIQKTATNIEIRFVRDQNSQVGIDIGGLQSFLRNRLHPTVQIAVVEVPEITRAASGKYEAWISLVT
ncbi:MAG: hypothetical protein NXI17_21560 [Alphaproteobacteria bacterium]|nr:hypothetical protein [Alphaproteobacteria bacterium]